MSMLTSRGASVSTPSGSAVSRRSARAVVSAINLDSQHRLFELFREAIEVSGKDMDDVARELGVPTSTVEAVLSGDRDMTLTEIRQFAYAVDTVIVYQGMPRATDNLLSRAKTIRQMADVSWVPNDWEIVESSAR